MDARCLSAFTIPVSSVQQKKCFRRCPSWWGTIPPLGAPYNTAGCVAVVNTLNGEIKTMAAANNVPVADFNAALQSVGITTTGDSPVIVLTANGYALMVQVYGDV